MLNIVSPSRYKIDRKMIKSDVEKLLILSGLPSHVLINLVFVGKQKMKFISAKYKKENVALPVLSFNYQIEPKTEENLIGEIFICYPQAVLLAAEKEKKVDRVLMQLIKHGINNILK